VDDGVSEMLGSDPLTGLTLHIYATEADYIAANPAAADHAGIMAHATPNQLEVGVAVERLRQVAPEIATQSFRHEMTHVVAAALSDQNLPIGFQEGLAQYNELSTQRAQDSMQALKSAMDTGAPLLSWDELNRPMAFSQHTALAYPEAYSVMAFLADRYGMGDFSGFLAALKGGQSWSSALATAYGQSVRRLQTEWQAYLPDFVRTGWQKNLLTYYDLSPGIALYDAGQFKQAVAHFTQSKLLYAQLGRTARAQVASDYLDKAQSASDAEDQAAGARTALESYDYQSAYTGAQKAAQALSDLNLEAQSSAANDTLALAQKGLGALASLGRAKAHMNGLDLLGARSDARAAVQVFADMGDTAHTTEATQLISQLSGMTTLVGFGVLGTGALALLIGVIVGIHRWYDDLGRVRAKTASAPLLNAGKENAEWM
jgi:Peptidase MA superfamily